MVFSQGYKVAIFDYDIRPSDEMTVAKYLEQQLQKTGLSFSAINQYTGEENSITTRTLLSSLDSQDYDLIITITSDAMGPALRNVKNTPWLFTNINNPTFFGIDNPEKPGMNRSGATYYIPVVRQLAFYNEIMKGQLKKVGIIFDDKAASRKVEVREFRDAAKELNIISEIKIIKDNKELVEATDSLLSYGVDAIILTSSGLLYNNVELIEPKCSSSSVPIFSVNKKGVPKGALAAFASDYYIMVDECIIPMAKEILSNNLIPGEMPIQSLDDPFVYLNITIADKLDIKIPPDIVKKASNKF